MYMKKLAGFEDAVRQSESQVLQVCHPVETELSKTSGAILSGLPDFPSGWRPEEQGHRQYQGRPCR